MKKLIERIIFFFSYDLVGAKAVGLVWGPTLGLIALSQWINKLDPKYVPLDLDPLYWGDKLLLGGSLYFIFMLGANFIVRLAIDGKPKDSK